MSMTSIYYRGEAKSNNLLNFRINRKVSPLFRRACQAPLVLSVLPSVLGGG